MTGGIVFFGGGKGGVGKSATSHGACLGAILNHQSAVYVLTDPKRKMREEGRPYGVLDGREPQTLANILNEGNSPPTFKPMHEVRNTCFYDGFCLTYCSFT